MTAVEAMGVGGIAVQLNNFVFGYARLLMQAVDILGDDMADNILFDELGDGVRRLIRISPVDETLANACLIIKKGRKSWINVN